MIKFNGEHLLIGQIGYFLTLLAFCSALVAAYSNFKAAGAKDMMEERSWQRLATRHGWAEQRVRNTHYSVSAKVAGNSAKILN